MRAFDTETFLTEPGDIIPPMVCLTTSDGELFNAQEGCAWFDANLGVNLLIGHNVFYDLAVAYEAYKDRLPNLLARIFHAIDAGLVSCTQIREKMIAVATDTMKFIKGVKRSFALSALVHNRFGVKMEGKKGPDVWRMRYSELAGIPVAEWPEAARSYAILDAEWTLAVYEDQGGVPLHQEITQIQAAWALHLTAAWGLRTDPPAVEKLAAELQTEFDTNRAIAHEDGLVQRTVKKKSGAVKYSKHMKSIRDRIILRTPPGGRVVYTPGGAISTCAEVINGLSAEDPGLQALSKMAKVEKVLKTYIPVMQSGMENAICTYYNAIQETYRTSSSKPNVQNPPRKGGVRESFVPRAGKLFLFCDYDTIELRSLTQVNIDLGHKPDMLAALEAGMDLHLAFAAGMLGITYTEAVARYADDGAEITAYRQYAKCANFGIPGGMGAEKFVDFCKSMGVVITIEFARDLKKRFLGMWSEMGKYFAYCSDLMQGADTAKVKFVRSGLERDGVYYCAVCNGFFQHLAAMGAKAALYAVVKECLTDIKSPLYGCRPVLFLHDEIGLEIPEDRVQERTARLQTVMNREMRVWIPDVPITCEAVVTKRWYKGAKPVFVGGDIVPCKPVDGKWVHDA